MGNLHSIQESWFWLVKSAASSLSWQGISYFSFSYSQLKNDLYIGVQVELSVYCRRCQCRNTNLSK